MRLHLVDGTFELFRAHYSPRGGHTTPDGRERKATAGIVSSMLTLLGDADEAPTHVAVAFDNPIRSFRNDLFDGYKSDEGVPPELREQFDEAEAGVRALGLVVWRMDRWECDDAIATAAARFRDQVEQVRILSPDKDFGQCLSGQRVVLVDRIRQRVIDEDAYLERFGIRPASVPDYLALVGDTADGIPGLRGIGAQTASTLLSAYGRLEDIPDDHTKWKVTVRGAEKVARTLREHRQDALLYRRLATLVTDVPLRESLADLAFRGVPRVRFDDWRKPMGVSAERALSRVRTV